LTSWESWGFQHDLPTQDLTEIHGYSKSQLLATEKTARHIAKVQAMPKTSKNIRVDWRELIVSHPKEK